jgi:RNA polymerase sigma factor (sigma-70 family)
MEQNESPPIDRRSDLLKWDALVAACAHDRSHHIFWAEFLRRYGQKIKAFIRGSWRIAAAREAGVETVSIGVSEISDLCQSVIVRLVEKDCAVMKRFSGKSEDEWLAYLAVISRSTVHDALRRERTKKRFRKSVLYLAPVERISDRDLRDVAKRPIAMERDVLAQELRSASEQMIQEVAESPRNLLIFKLHFDHDLPASQIAICEGINMSKAGVEKIINRFKEQIRNWVARDES